MSDKISIGALAPGDWFKINEDNSYSEIYLIHGFYAFTVFCQRFRFDENDNLLDITEVDFDKHQTQVLPIQQPRMKLINGER